MLNNLEDYADRAPQKDDEGDKIIISVQKINRDPKNFCYDTQEIHDKMGVSDLLKILWENQDEFNTDLPFEDVIKILMKDEFDLNVFNLFDLLMMKKFP
jgi:hypothetical protein